MYHRDEGGLNTPQDSIKALLTTTNTQTNNNHWPGGTPHAGNHSKQRLKARYQFWCGGCGPISSPLISTPVGLPIPQVYMYTHKANPNTLPLNVGQRPEFSSTSTACHSKQQLAGGGGLSSYIHIWPQPRTYRTPGERRPLGGRKGRLERKSESIVTTKKPVVSERNVPSINNA